MACCLAVGGVVVEHTLTQEQHDTSSWLTSLQAFRLALAQEVNSVVDSAESAYDPSKGRIRPEELDPIIYGRFNRFRGGEVLWQVTFMGINAYGYVELKEKTWPTAQDSVQAQSRGAMAAISVDIELSEKNRQKWEAIAVGQSIECKAKIKTMHMVHVFRKEGPFGGYWPMVTLTDAEPILPGGEEPM